MTYMKSSDAISYLQRNKLSNRMFWNDLVRFGDFYYIPTNIIKDEIGDTLFRQMECEVTTLVVASE